MEALIASMLGCHYKELIPHPLLKHSPIPPSFTRIYGVLAAYSLFDFTMQMGPDEDMGGGRRNDLPPSGVNSFTRYQPRSKKAPQLSQAEGVPELLSGA